MSFSLPYWIKAGFAILGTTLTLLLGGWDKAIEFLAYAMAGDFMFGVAAAIKEKRLSSHAMWVGGLKKAAILFVVIMAVKLDQLVGNADPLFRTMAIYFYIGREGLSLVEKWGMLGLPLPAFFGEVLEQMQSRKFQK